MQADEKKCPQCAEIVKSEAKICRYCRHSFENEISPISETPALSEYGRRLVIVCLTVFAIFIGLGILGSTLDPTTNRESVSGDVGESSGAISSVNQSTPSTEGSVDRPSIGIFGPRANAARSAQQYLNMTGFSRRGLIEQLSSYAGDGYSVADATAAVDSLDVDWNEQAARSARQYLNLTGFSCAGLIEQLSSDAGSKYTRAQARYGAEQAGAC